MVIQVDRRFSALVDDVARHIVSTEHFGSGSFIKLPILYPSGAAVTVQLAEQMDRYFVTDMGLGYQEAEMFGASYIYARAASTLAERYGVRFDNQAFFVAEASKEQLAGATVMIANCSAEATALAAQRSAEQKYNEDGDRLYKRLVQAFPLATISRNEDYLGASHHKWVVASVVRHSNVISLFDPVYKNHSSVVSTVAKFHDIARLDQPPRRIAVVEKKSDMGDLINVLSQAANVVEFETPIEKLRRLAA